MNTFKMGSITFTHIANISLSQAWLVNRNSETYGLYDFEGNEYATRKHWFSLLPRDISGGIFSRKEIRFYMSARVVYLENVFGHMVRLAG